jgi:hypothetical protein
MEGVKEMKEKYKEYWDKSLLWLHEYQGDDS